MVRWKSLVAFFTVAALPSSALMAQVAKPADPIAPLPDGTTPQAAQPAPAEPAPPPPAFWRVDQVQALLSYINGVGKDGLSPSDYEPAGLAAALRGGDPLKLSEVATDRFNRLSSDLALGHVRGKDRIDWHVEDPDLSPERQRQILDYALATDTLAKSLNDLLPTHPQYASLKQSLVITPASDTATVNKIRLNMDRWRWLPRDLGDRYIIVNVPSYYATLVENGVTRWKTRAVAGAIKTPTPQLTANAVGVILNPSWEVPKSIWPEVAGKAGYVKINDKNGKFLRWSQPPGPTNALGQLKFVMYNPHNIYLHDTNAKSRFNSSVRAASHGCIRTKDVLTLATMLLGDDGGEWTEEKIQEQLASKKTKQANFVKPLPVYIVYFSIAATNDGALVKYNDVYQRDGKVIAALLDAKGAAPDKTAPAKKVAAK